jgi:hypothetical protein
MKIAQGTKKIFMIFEFIDKTFLIFYISAVGKARKKQESKQKEAKRKQIFDFIESIKDLFP